MAQAKVDWSVLRGALGVLGICVLVSGIILGVSYYFREEMNTEFKRHHVRFRDISRKYLAVDEEERIIKTSYPHFAELYNRGVIGRESRLSWLETLRHAGDRIKIPELRYKIDSRSEYDPDYGVTTGAYRIYASKMELDLGLLHEGDFVALTEFLDREAEGLFSISKCSFKRVTAKLDLDPDKANLSARCELQWFTVNLPGDKEIVL